MRTTRGRAAPGADAVAALGDDDRVVGVGGVGGGALGSGGRMVRAAARVAVTWPGGQLAGQPSTAVTGRTPATALVTKTSVALASSSRVSGFWPTLIPWPWAARMTAARVVPGSRRPSAGGVSSTPSM